MALQRSSVRMPFEASLVIPILIGFAIGGVAGVMLSRFLVAGPRMRRFAAYTEALLQPSPATPPRPPGRGRLSEALQQVGARLNAAETMATTDQLTGVLNRQASLRRLAAELERSGRYGSPVMVGLADIDHFKRVNDTYGHAAGDVVLRHVAQLIRGDLRTSDTVGRYGGEEFLLILPETDIQDAASAADKIRRLVGRTPATLPDGQQLAVTISIGVGRQP